MIDGETVDQYVRDLIVWSSHSTSIEFLCLIVQDLSMVSESRLTTAKRRLRKNGVFGGLSKTIFGLICRFERKLLERRADSKRYLSRHDISSVSATRVRVKPIVSKSGQVYRYLQTDIDAISELNLDLIVRCGSGIQKGEILEVARLGIISFHHGDNRVHRGGPAGFWEVYKKLPQTGFVIQRLTDVLDAGDVLMRGGFPTQFYFSLNQMYLLEQSNHHMLDLLVDIAKRGSLPLVQATSTALAPLLKSPSLFTSSSYFLVFLLRLIRKVFMRATCRAIKWTVLIEEGNWYSPANTNQIRIDSARGSYRADPFLLNIEGDTYCLVENYRFETGKANIEVYKIDDNKAIRLGVCLEEAWHLSFPYLFWYKSALYMCPESANHGDIRIYKCNEFPLKWELESIAMTGLSAAETMIFEFEGLWWMLTNLDRSGMRDHSSELFAFWSDNPISGEWHAHSLNPLYVDSSLARNGGLIHSGDRVLRISQRQGFDVYGEDVAIREITRLTPTEFEEQEIGTKSAKNIRGAVSCHHLSACSGFIASDFAKVGFIRSK